MNRDITFHGYTYRVNIEDGGNTDVARGESFFKTLRANAIKRKNDIKPSGMKLLANTCKYLGWRQAAWTDDSFYEVQFEGTWSTQAYSNLAMMCPRDTSIDVDEKNKRIRFLQSYSIGD